MNSPKMDRNRCVGDFCLKLFLVEGFDISNYICDKSKRIGNE